MDELYYAMVAISLGMGTGLLLAMSRPDIARAFARYLLSLFGERDDE